MPIATTDEQRALAESLRSWGRDARPVAIARAQETQPGRWRELWPALAGFGVFVAAVPESSGGGGGSLVDTAVLLEQATDLLVPGPVLSTALAAVLLSRAGGHDLLPSVLDGTLPVAVALDAGSVTRTGSGLSGATGPVAGAEAGVAVLLPTRAGEWFLVPDGDGVKPADHGAADFSRALATVHLETASGERLALDSALVTDLAATLAAAEAAGVAGWALRTAVKYATVREQFGAPIGSFQAVKHLCAQMLCRAELASAVAWDAARCAADDAQRPLASAVAAAVAAEAAVENAKDCIQVLGGIGFTWEHDAHLYLRRALATRALFGGNARRRVAVLTLAGERRALHVDVAAPDGLRDQVRAGAERIAALPAKEQRAALADSGYLVPAWPAPYGRGAAPAEQLVVEEELQRAGVQRPDLVIAGWAVPTILAHGTTEQAQRFAGPTLRGEITWCQLFSEPGAGSDLAALRTRAERTAGGWRLTGQKVWTSLAHRADWAICLARTNPDVPKHKGISYFLLDMASPGIEVRPLREITGEARFNEVFLDGVFVPDDCLVGDVDGGWALARATLGSERLAIGGTSAIGAEVEHLLALAQERGAVADPAVLDRLGGLVADGVAGSLLDLRTTLRRLEGGEPGAAASVRKLVGVAHRQAVADAALDLLGADGAASGPELEQLLMTRCLSIAGGTTQVLLTLAAERLLGLPRG